jgi:tetratricopeptide (TPR) repeat protein
MRRELKEAVLERYLAGDLAGAELSDFEKLLLVDEGLAAEVRFQKELFEAILDEKKSSLRATLNNIHNGRNIKSKFRIYSWKTQSIAATILVTILLGGSLLFNQVFNSSTEQKLFNQYFQPESTILTVRSAGAPMSAIEKGMSFYELEEYEKAISAFSIDSDNLLGKLYSGYSFMHLEKYNFAEEQFIAILNNRNNLLLDQAEWNLGLCYLKTGESDKAKNIFDHIAKTQTNYKNKALELLNEMGSN